MPYGDEYVKEKEPGVSGRAMLSGEPAHWICRWLGSLIVTMFLALSSCTVSIFKSLWNFIFELSWFITKLYWNKGELYHRKRQSINFRINKKLFLGNLHSKTAVVVLVVKITVLSFAILYSAKCQQYQIFHRGGV